MTLKEYYDLKDAGKIVPKVIFLNNGEIVVEAFEAEGMYFLDEYHVDIHKEKVIWHDRHGFSSKEKANSYFVNCIKNQNFIIGGNSKMSIPKDNWDEDEVDDEYEKDYGPSNPWDAPGMKISDFIGGVCY